jgi:hypothetical protein
MEDLSSKIKKQSRDQVLGHVWANTHSQVWPPVGMQVQDKTREQIQRRVEGPIKEAVNAAVR